MPKKIELIGHTYGRLLVVEESSERTKDGKIQYYCKCSCGNPTLVLKRASLLRSGDSKSCGCLQSENALRQLGSTRDLHKTHGMSSSPTYVCWKNMKARCDDVNHQAYDRYGARGIGYQDSWTKFEPFLEDMGEMPHGLSLNRIDPNKGYSKENCEWATREKQARDTRKVRGCSCKYKGVTWNKAEQKYKAGIKFKGKIYHLGYSDDPLELALRYDEKVREFYGEDCGTNKQLGLLD